MITTRRPICRIPSTFGLINRAYERTNERTNDQAHETVPFERFTSHRRAAQRARPRIRSIRPIVVDNLNLSTTTGTLHSESHLTNGPCAAAVLVQSPIWLESKTPASDCRPCDRILSPIREPLGSVSHLSLVMERAIGQWTHQSINRKMPNRLNARCRRRLLQRADSLLAIRRGLGV